MSELKYRLYCYIHYTVKRLLGRANLSVGNILKSLPFKMGVKYEEAIGLWNEFINKSVIISNDFNSTLFAGYIAENKEWILPSWIWTNAAVVREYCFVGWLEEAKTLAEKLANQQQECGAWIVRNDYDEQGPIPMLAPNDSAYIANNAFLSLYEKTKDKNYLSIACRCADWIIETARPDGMVHTGYNVRDGKWDKDCVIVDVGFTGGLFSRLIEFTHEEKYLTF